MDSMAPLTHEMQHMDLVRRASVHKVNPNQPGNIFVFVLFLCALDSDLSARQEIKFFFPEFDYDEWFDKEEAIYRTGPTTFDTKTIQHFADTKSQT